MKEPIPDTDLVSSGTRSGPPAGPQKPSPTLREPAPARQMRPAGDANPRPTGARDAGGTQSGTSPSTRPSTPPEEKRATSWTEKSGRGETEQISPLGLQMKLSLSKNVELHLDVVAPSGSDLHSLIRVTVSSVT